MRKNKKYRVKTHLRKRKAIVNPHSSVKPDNRHKPLVGTGVLDGPYKRKANLNLPLWGSVAYVASDK